MKAWGAPSIQRTPAEDARYLALVRTMAIYASREAQDASLAALAEAVARAQRRDGVRS